MCSAGGLVSILIAGLVLNCLLLQDDGGDGGVKEGSTRAKKGAVSALHIDITRKPFIHINGIEISEDSLVEYLEKHEQDLIFGKSKSKRAIKLVHLRLHPDVADAPTGKDAVTMEARMSGAQHKTRRPKRSPHTSNVNASSGSANSSSNNHSTVENESLQQLEKKDVSARQQYVGNGNDSTPAVSQEVSVQIKDNDELVNLKLHQSPQLIDDSFVFIRRYANSSQFIADSHKLAERYANCFYSNEDAALDLCDDENVRGIFQHNSTNFIIHPLPSRFGNASHVIVESLHDQQRQQRFYGDMEAVPPNLMDMHLQFEPEEEDFNELSIMQMASTTTEFLDADFLRPTRNIASANGPITNALHTQRTAAAAHWHKNSQRLHQQNHHNRASGTGTSTPPQLDLNLRYRPRYHRHEHRHQHQHQQHHQHHKNKYNSHRQQQKQPTNLKHHQFRHKLQHKPNNHLPHHSHQQKQTLNSISKRSKRYVASASENGIPPPVLYVETAIFVDSDLFRHMAKNFPTNTERQLVRFVLAMINGVQLLYHDPSLGRRINFILKRLEILYNDPAELMRSSDIDTYLSNFCMWQKEFNPPSDANEVHYDHAVILTGLDLYVVGKNGKTISQVVGLAPVAGMCTPTSSCTINEGKHFESVFVVAHEIGHNLGMRHDTNENSCDSSLFIMSPTLGSGKTTWSKCSRGYLNKFLETRQARCLFDQGEYVHKHLDHSAEGILPGERFDANQQCMLKYGRESVRARSQNMTDICRDLHCQRDRYTWTSHPALEGTQCGDSMWCRSGKCIGRALSADANNSLKQTYNSAKSGYDKVTYTDNPKKGPLLHEYSYNKSPKWSDWGQASDCDSGCLYGSSKRLREGSTGLRTYHRTCLNPSRRCLGNDRKFESCIAKQCYSIAITTIESFADDVCKKAQKFDAELTGEGQQIVGNIDDACKVICKTKTNGTRSRNWTFPDGTTCRTKLDSYDDISYCIAGRCEKFSCENASTNYYRIDPIFCRNKEQKYSANSEENQSSETRRFTMHTPVQNRFQDNGSLRDKSSGIYGPTTVRSKYENEVAVRSFHGQTQETSYKRKLDSYQSWNKYNYHLNTPPPVTPPSLPLPIALPHSASLVVAPENEWIVKSGCHSNCMTNSKGIQVVSSRRTGANNIQLCSVVKPCERLLSTTEFAENTCARYKLKVRGLSGHGTQIAASIDEPDRSCRVGCQDEFIKYRYYLVNSKYGHFPLGTKCSNTEERYCVNGKCLEFGRDNIPLQQSHISLALFRNRRSLSDYDEIHNSKLRSKRSYLYYNPVNITETITQEFINNIVDSIKDLDESNSHDDSPINDHIEFTNPIHISTDELMSTN